MHFNIPEMIFIIVITVNPHYQKVYNNTKVLL